MKKSFLLVLAALVLMVGSAFAQDKVELSGAYQSSTVFSYGTSNTANPGWQASAAYYLGKSPFAVVTEWTGTDFNSASKAAVNTGAGGLQYQFNRTGKLRPYVNVLFGDTKYTTGGSVNAFSQQAGAGLDLSLSKHFAVRGGLDYFHADSAAQYASANGIRPIAGIVVRF